MHQGHSDLKKGLKLLLLENIPSDTKFADSLKIYQYFRKFLISFVSLLNSLISFLSYGLPTYLPYNQLIQSVSIKLLNYKKHFLISYLIFLWSEKLRCVKEY